MKKFFSSLCAAAVLLGSAAAGTTAAGAAPLNVPRAIAQDATDVTNVQQRRGFHRQGNRYYYNGHRGHRERRPGYRQHNGWWFPPAAFTLGVIIGSQQQQYRPPAHRGPAYRAPGYRAPAYRGNARAAHVRWCQGQYRSYRVSDNTFQPYNGPRRQCVSPYS